MGGEHHQLKGARPARPHTNRKGGYNRGEHLVVSDRSGFVYDSSKVTKEWTGLIVGEDECEPRHPQEFRRGIREDIAVREARPKSPTTATLPVSLADVSVVSGSVAGGVYTSDPATELRPLVYWTLDLGAEFDLVDISIEGLSLSGGGGALVRRGLRLGVSPDGAAYTDLNPPIGDFAGGVGPAPADYVASINAEGRFLRLALTAGRGVGFTGALSHGAITITRGV